jgi:hypothetical protein
MWRFSLIKNALSSRWIVVVGGIGVIFCLYMAFNYTRLWVWGLPVIGAGFIIVGLLFGKE